SFNGAAVEDRGRVHPVHPGCAPIFASMGPRSKTAEEEQELAELQYLLAASMGPRSKTAEEGSSSSRCLSLPLLQWGRGRRPRKSHRGGCRPLPRRASMGPRSKTAEEVSERVCCSRPFASFNGAAVEDRGRV